MRNKLLLLGVQVLVVVLIGRVWAEEPISIEVALDMAAYLEVNNGKVIINKTTEDTKFSIHHVYGVTSIKGLDKLPNLEKVALDYGGYDFSNAEEEFLRGIPQLKKLQMATSTLNIASTKFLSRLPNLEDLSLDINIWKDSPKVHLVLTQDMNYLKDFFTRSVYFTDFDFLQHVPIVEEMWIGNLNYDPQLHFSMLEPLEKLKILTMDDILVTDTTFLAHTPVLEELTIRYRHHNPEYIPEFTLTKKNTRIKKLMIKGMHVNDLSFLQYLPNLEYLSIGVWDKLKIAGKIQYASTVRNDETLWKQVPKLKTIYLSEELRPKAGVLSKVTQAEETKNNTLGIK